MKRTLLLLLPAVVLVGLAGRADAQSRSSHERIKATPIKKKGATVGLRLKMTLRPTSEHTNVRIGLGPGDTTYASDYREQAADPAKGYLLHQFPEITDLKAGEPKEVTLEVMYKDAPKLTPGQKVEVISAWNNKDHNASYWHVWGMQKAQVDASSVIDLPGSPEELAKAESAGGGRAAASSAARARTRARAASRLSASRQSAARSRATRSRSAARARRAAQTRASRTRTRTRSRSARTRARGAGAGAGATAPPGPFRRDSP